MNAPAQVPGKSPDNRAFQLMVPPVGLEPTLP